MVAASRMGLTGLKPRQFAPPSVEYAPWMMAVVGVGVGVTDEIVDPPDRHHVLGFEGSTTTVGLFALPCFVTSPKLMSCCSARVVRRRRQSSPAASAPPGPPAQPAAPASCGLPDGRRLARTPTATSTQRVTRRSRTHGHAPPWSPLSTAKLCGKDSDCAACVGHRGQVRFKESRKHAGSTPRCQIFSIRLGLGAPHPESPPLPGLIAHSPRSLTSTLGPRACIIHCYHANSESIMSMG